MAAFDDFIDKNRKYKKREKKTSEILYSRTADDFFQDLFISDFPPEFESRLLEIHDARDLMDAEIDELLDDVDWELITDSGLRNEVHEKLNQSIEQQKYSLLDMPIQPEVLEKYFISAVPVNTYIGAVTALQVGYAIPINRGISSGLSSNTVWFNMVKDIWKNCFKNIHPFQKGDTNQGTKHCMTIVKYFNKLRYRLLSLDLWDAVILLISAAVHDIGKALVLQRRHQIVAHDFICTNFSELSIQEQWNIPVCPVVKFHTGSPSLNLLSTSVDYEVDDGLGSRVTKSSDIQMLAAIFRLCDVADMTRTRISDTVFSLNKEKLDLSDAEHEKMYWKLFSRNKIEKIKLKQDHFEVTIASTVTDSHELAKIEDSVNYDNKDLEDSHTSSILQTHNLPYEFRIA